MIELTKDDIAWAKAIVAPVCRKAMHLKEDIQSEAVIALWKFSLKYDPTIADDFRAVAYKRVFGAAMDVLRKDNSSYRNFNKFGKKKVVPLSNVAVEYSNIAVDQQTPKKLEAYENRDFLHRYIEYYKKQNKRRSDGRVKFLELVQTESCFEDIAAKLGRTVNSVWTTLWYVQREINEFATLSLGT